MRKAALFTFLVGLAAVVVFEAVPWLDRERDFPAAIPNPPALQVVSLDVVRGGQKLCMRDIAADPHGRVVRFQVGTYRKPGPPLALTITAPGYRTGALQPGGYADNSTLQLPVAAPAHATLVTACIANGGPQKVALYSSGDRARSRAVVDVNGHPQDATPWFGFWERKPASIADRAGLTVDRMATFHGFLGHTWLLWALIVLFVLGMPVALALALWRGLPR